MDIQGLEARQLTRFASSRVTWTYDATYQLLSEQRDGLDAYAHTFTYDAVGNRLTKAEDGDVTTSTYDAANRLHYSVDSIGDRTTYTYDANGNQRSVEAPSGNVTTQSWSYENKLVGLEQPTGDLVTYTYSLVKRDDTEQRVSKDDDTTFIRFVWDEDRIIAELDDVGSPEAEYTLEPATYGNLMSQKRATGSSYYHYDALGSTHNLTDTTEVQTDDYSYYAFGELVASSGSSDNNFQWIGQFGYYYDPESGHQTVRENAYGPVQASWLSPDKSPRRGRSSYEYSRNNPVRYKDPAGTIDFEFPSYQLTDPDTLFGPTSQPFNGFYQSIPGQGLQFSAKAESNSELTAARTFAVVAVKLGCSGSDLCLTPTFRWQDGRTFNFKNENEFATYAGTLKTQLALESTIGQKPKLTANADGNLKAFIGSMPITGAPATADITYSLTNQGGSSLKLMFDTENSQFLADIDSSAQSLQGSIRLPTIDSKVEYMYNRADRVTWMTGITGTNWAVRLGSDGMYPAYSAFTISGERLKASGFARTGIEDDVEYGIMLVETFSSGSFDTTLNADITSTNGQFKIETMSQQGIGGLPLSLGGGVRIGDGDDSIFVTGSMGDFLNATKGVFPLGLRFSIDTTVKGKTDAKLDVIINLP